MKKVYCDLHMFDLKQEIFILDTETKETQVITTATLEELPEIICAVCHHKNLDDVLLTGNSIYCSAVAEDVVTYSKINYNNKNINVEVLKK